MTAEYVFYLNLVLLSRLPLTSCAQEKQISRTLTVGAMQFLALFAFYRVGGQLLLAAAVAVVTALGALALWKQCAAEKVWGLQFVAVCICSSFGFNEESHLAVWLTDTAHLLADKSALLTAMNPEAWRKANLLLFGSLVLANEPNLWMRVMFRALKISLHDGPQGSADASNAEVGLNAGRVIGILERNLMYIAVVLANNYAAVGFIIAAKGFARFKQMDKRPFAEYVLIGTLTSTLITLVVAQAVQLLLS